MPPETWTLRTAPEHPARAPYERSAHHDRRHHTPQRQQLARAHDDARGAHVLTAPSSTAVARVTPWVLTAVAATYAAAQHVRARHLSTDDIDAGIARACAHVAVGAVDAAWFIGRATDAPVRTHPWIAFTTPARADTEGPLIDADSITTWHRTHRAARKTMRARVRAAASAHGPDRF